MYAVQVTGYYFNGINCQGLPVFGSTPNKQYSTKSAAAEHAALLGGQVVLLPSWQWNY